jgi:predicted DNA-binding transcriptional regulator AlpA
MTTPEIPESATVAELARILKLSQTAIYKHINRAQLPSVHKTGRRKRYNVEAVMDAVLRHRQDDARHVGTNKLRDQKTALEIELLEIKRRQALGELVDASTVENRHFKLYRALRDAILMVPEDVADDLAAIDRPDRVQAVLAEALRGALEAITMQHHTDDEPDDEPEAAE